MPFINYKLAEEIPKAFEVLFQVQRFLIERKHEEAEKLLKENEQLLKRIFDEEKLEIGNLRQKKTLEKIKQSIALKLSQNKPFGRSSLDDILKMNEIALQNLKNWGFTDQEIKILILVKRQKIQL